jgi:hypothetical protein
MKETPTVKVVKCRYKDFWYNRHIGETFKVMALDEDDYIILSNDYPSEGVYIECASIERDDCVIVEDIKPPRYMDKHTMI